MINICIYVFLCQFSQCPSVGWVLRQCHRREVVCVGLVTCTWDTRVPIEGPTRLGTAGSPEATPALGRRHKINRYSLSGFVLFSTYKHILPNRLSKVRSVSFCFVLSALPGILCVPRAHLNYTSVHTYLLDKGPSLYKHSQKAYSIIYCAGKSTVKVHHEDSIPTRAQTHHHSDAEHRHYRGISSL